MYTKTHAFRPGSEDLEMRLALSSGIQSPQAAIGSLHKAPTPRPTVAGSLAGRYFASGLDNRPADEPYRVDVNAIGRVTGLGRVTMTGTISFGGFTIGGQGIVGRVTLTNAKGSITVHLTGNDGSSPIPGRRVPLTASISEGTGAYAGTQGAGRAGVHFGPNLIRSITTPSPIGGRLAFNISMGPLVLRPTPL
ncbi:hypothetical protein EP7_000007 [Isosphaeraceae bacterium EP7]